MDQKENEAIWDNIWSHYAKEEPRPGPAIFHTVVKTADRLKQAGVKKVLDLGCGSGRNAVYLAQRGFTVTAADISQQALSLTEHRAKECHVTVQTSHADMEKLPFYDAEYDAVICMLTLGHGLFADLKRQLAEIFRIIRPDGYFAADFGSLKGTDFSRWKEIERNTYLGKPGEEGIPHHFCDENEIKELFRGCRFRLEPVAYSYPGEDGKTEFIYNNFIFCQKQNPE